MHDTGPSRAVTLPRALGTTLIAAALTSGCVGAEAALAEGECSQTDSTVTCCLKMHPGQYERCGVTPPTRSEQLNVGPPGLFKSEEQEESREERDRRCADYYARCIDKMGPKQGSVYGTTHCRDCFTFCSKHGFWPERVNRKKCPGS